MNFSGRYVSPAPTFLINMHLMDMHLTGTHLTGVHLIGTHLTDVHLVGIHLLQTCVSGWRKKVAKERSGECC
jgi:hypothetical protein